MEFQNTERYDLNANELRRFEESFEIDPDTQCWVWIKNCDAQGYGRFAYRNKIARAHRVAFEHYNKIKANDILDHYFCDNKSCVNPHHVRLSNHRENTLRGNAPSALNARKLHCACGNEFDYYWYDKDHKLHRQCKSCQKLRVKRWRQARRDKGLPYS